MIVYLRPGLISDTKGCYSDKYNRSDETIKLMLDEPRFLAALLNLSFSPPSHLSLQSFNSLNTEVAS